MKLNLYIISQTVNRDYDTYDFAIVAAKNEKSARLIHPNGEKWDGSYINNYTWTDSRHVKVKLIGVAKPRTKAGVILSSFNAG